MDPTYDMPQEDAWIIRRVCSVVAERLISADHDAAARRSLIHLLFGLQRLPCKTPGLSVSIWHGAFVELSSECFGLTFFTEDHHTELRLQYFDTSHHCLHWHDELVGDEKRRAMESRLDDLQEAFDAQEFLYIEDYSMPEADLPPYALR